MEWNRDLQPLQKLVLCSSTKRSKVWGLGLHVVANVPLNQENPYHPFWGLTGLEVTAAFSSGDTRRNFSDSRGIIPDVVEKRSWPGPPFIALVRYRTAKLTKRPCQLKNLPLACLFACAFVYLFSFVGFFGFFFNKKLSTCSWLMPDHRPSSPLVTQPTQRSSVALFCCRSIHVLGTQRMKGKIKDFFGGTKVSWWTHCWFTTSLWTATALFFPNMTQFLHIVCGGLYVLFMIGRTYLKLILHIFGLKWHFKSMQ